MIPSYGILGKDASLQPVVHGVQFDPELPTRREEYHLVARVAEAVDGWHAWDAGTGFIASWHVAPYILSALNWAVDATDVNAAHLAMPADRKVTRYMRDMVEPPPAAHYDLVISISVLEHVTPEVRTAFSAHVADVTRRGDVLLVTADEVDPVGLCCMFTPAFDFGERVPDPVEYLTPSVSFCIGRRV